MSEQLRRSALASVLLFAGALTACSTTNTTTAGPPATGSTPPSTAPRAAATARSTTTESESSEDTEAASARAACELITEQDATDAFGEPAVAGDQRADECWWSSANDLKTV